jgi:plastocyanin
VSLPDANGCKQSTAADHTADTAVTIGFGGANGSPALGYAPQCIKIASSTKVTFSGDFTIHPLIGGTVLNGSASPDSSSPLKSPASGNTVDFTPGTTAPTGAVFPYYCGNHYSAGMMGAIYVVK